MKAVGAGVAVLATGAGRSSGGERKRPNILFIFTDDQRWDTIGALGNPAIHTPNLDRLVRDGFHFNNAYCMGSMVGAVCLPSRTMLATGRSLWRIPANPRAKTPPPGVPLLPVALNDAGYETFHSGKAGNACTFSNACFRTNIETRKHDVNSATEHADNAIKFLRGHDGNKPFFIYLAPPVPHDPRLAPPEFVKLYDPAKVTLSKNFMPEHPFDNGELKVRDEMLAAHPRTAEEMRRHVADYYATVSHLDHEVGRVLDAVRERDWADNTVVIFSSDQGLAVGGRHGLMGKQNLYEFGGMHVPLCIAGPGIPAGRSDAFVYLMDLYPAVCELAGATLPEGVEAKSILPVVQGKTKALRDALYTAYMNCQRSVRDDRWKLIRYPLVDKTQLYDLTSDPREMTNLADRPEHAAKLAEMTALLTRQQKLWGDPAPLKVDDPKPAEWTPPAGKGGKDKKSEKKRKK